MDVFLMRVRQVGPASWLWTVGAPETGGDAFTVRGLEFDANRAVEAAARKANDGGASFDDVPCPVIEAMISL